MLFHVVTVIMMILTDVSFSADIQLTLQDTAVNDNNAKGLKSIAIKGLAKYKPGGSAMILSLLIQGPPGIMPGAPAPGGPTKSPAPGGPSSSPAPGGPSSSPAPGGPTSSPGSGSTCPPATTAGPQATSAKTPSPTPTPSSGPGGASQSPTSGSTTGGGGGGGAFQDFEKAALDEHNKFRKIHGSQPMKLNRQMCDEAAEYAKIIAQSHNMRHSSKEQRKGQGENLAMACSNKGGLTTRQAVVNWYNEVCKPGYEFSVGKGQSGTGHFTQVVWNDSVELGIGKADGQEGNMKCTYVVGRYKPLGNFFTGNDDYKKNVKEGSFNRQAYCSSIKTKGGFKKSAFYFGKVLKRK